MVVRAGRGEYLAHPRLDALLPPGLAHHLVGKRQHGVGHRLHPGLAHPRGAVQLPQGDAVIGRAHHLGRVLEGGRQLPTRLHQPPATRPEIHRRHPLVLRVDGRRRGRSSSGPFRQGLKNYLPRQPPTPHQRDGHRLHLVAAPGGQGPHSPPTQGKGGGRGGNAPALPPTRAHAHRQ
ncbi:hypothetical protein BU14_0634s0001 [Porphyra umbilicalis]|uniref:Uncharacterized protein n=1 Tax=Porphyra umbilicalis TaxID=2786 RepID=A0A1X6NQR2_PORUM|nr:hypothetical protein BU14_0634s0001 [Porphyra umbilicalis]|eukprot:OSX70915.1 hypothetical protein BU14_0634s0001 [Porphyra umbilicalis]